MDFPRHATRCFSQNRHVLKNRMSFSLKSIAVCLLLISISSFAEERNFGFIFANTVAGELSIVKSVDDDDEIFLVGRRILKGDAKHVLWFVADARPAAGSASIVLLGFDTGDNSCRFMYRIIDFSSSKMGRLTPEFGDCSEYSYKSSLKAGAPGKSIPAAWVLSGFSGGDAESGAQFVYRDGKIFRGGRQITGAGETVPVP